MISEDCYHGNILKTFVFKYVILRSALELLYETKAKMMSCLQNDSFVKFIPIFI